MQKTATENLIIWVALIAILGVTIIVVLDDITKDLGGIGNTISSFFGNFFSNTGAGINGFFKNLFSGWPTSSSTD